MDPDTRAPYEVVRELTLDDALGEPPLPAMAPGYEGPSELLDTEDGYLTDPASRLEFRGVALWPRRRTLGDDLNQLAGIAVRATIVGAAVVAAGYLLGRGLRAGLR